MPGFCLCTGKPLGNCPSPLGPDFDFASSPMLLTAGARQVLIAGAKSGIVYGLDATAQGRLLWQRALAAGTPNGAILWAPATDGDAPTLPHPSTTRSRGRGRARSWHSNRPPVPCCGAPRPRRARAPGERRTARTRCSPGSRSSPGSCSPAPWTATCARTRRATGRIVWQFDTGQSFDAVNGVRAHGGAIDYGGEVIAQRHAVRELRLHAPARQPAAGVFAPGSP